jgi:hypothetical protein
MPTLRPLPLLLATLFAVPAAAQDGPPVPFRAVAVCPGSTGAHTYFFGQNDAVLLAGTGDTGNACVMRSADRGDTWAVGLAASQLDALIGSADAKAVFGLVHLGAGRWPSRPWHSSSRVRARSATS